MLDASARLARWSSEVRPYAPEELGFGPDLEDTVVSWQTVPKAYPSRPGAMARVRLGSTAATASLHSR